ncbi:MAG: ABC transporter ATP-binding protein, partial [Pseudomonadota bacterium]
GIRPHFVSPVKSDSSLALDGKNLVTELSGSESTVHFSIDDDFWVSQAHGIHEFQVGVTARLYADLSKAMYFDSDGTAIAGETNG